MLDRLERIVLHPFLFAIYPPLFLLVNNLHELRFVSGLRAIMLSLLFSTLLFFLSSLITKDTKRTALITSFTSILFFAYGPIHSLVPAYRVFGSLLTNQRFMLIFWGLIFIMMIWLLGWKIRKLSGLNTFMNFAGTILMVFVVFQAILAVTHKTYDQTNGLIVQDVTKSLVPPPLDQRPDVYYIILDTYSSARVLKDEYNIDDSDFINELKKRGFYVAECSRANYPHTVFSLASSLNMDYIPPVGEQFLKDPEPWLKFASYFRSNAVRNAFVKMGYSTVTFDTFYPWTNITDSDIFITPSGKPEANKDPFLVILNTLGGRTNDYEEMLMNMTPLVNRKSLSAILNIDSDESQPYYNSLTGYIPNDTQNVEEQKILYHIFKSDLEQLAFIPSFAGKKFIYAHIFTTHPPLLFAEDGSFKPDDTLTGYENTIRYTNKMILYAVDQIIAHSDPKPVIIIQGDHARGLAHNPFGILNAYYLPGVDQNILYPAISPVNSFRVVFNEFFGGNFPLLPDFSYPVTNNTDWTVLPKPVMDLPDCP